MPSPRPVLLILLTERRWDTGGEIQKAVLHVVRSFGLKVKVRAHRRRWMTLPILLTFSSRVVISTYGWALALWTKSLILTQLHKRDVIASVYRRSFQGAQKLDWSQPPNLWDRAGIKGGLNEHPTWMPLSAPDSMSSIRIHDGVTSTQGSGQRTLLIRCYFESSLMTSKTCRTAQESLPCNLTHHSYTLSSVCYI